MNLLNMFSLGMVYKLATLLEPHLHKIGRITANIVTVVQYS